MQEFLIECRHVELVAVVVDDSVGFAEQFMRVLDHAPRAGLADGIEYQFAATIPLRGKAERIARLFDLIDGDILVV